MKNKILYVILAVVFIAAVVMTVIKGLNVGVYYGEGYTISFTEEDTINLNDIKSIANEIWVKDVIVQKMEFFNDSAEIKVKEYNDEQLTKLKDKINEKYGSELEVEDFRVNHVANIRIRNLVEPYIIPIGLSLLGILVFYAARYRRTKTMIGLIVSLVIVGGLFFSVHAILRVPIVNLTMPIALLVFALVVLVYTVYSEKQIGEE